MTLKEFLKAELIAETAKRNAVWIEQQQIMKEATAELEKATDEQVVEIAKKFGQTTWSLASYVLFDRSAGLCNKDFFWSDQHNAFVRIPRENLVPIDPPAAEETDLNI